MLDPIQRNVRYQTKQILIPANPDPQIIHKSIELYEDMPYCTGIAVNIYTGYLQSVKMELSDGIQKLLNSTPIDFFQDSTYKAYLPLVIEAKGKKIDIDFTHSGTELDVIMDIVFLLENEKPEGIYPYTYSLHEFTDTTKNDFQTSLFNLPVEHRYVNGIWIKSRSTKLGSFSYTDNDKPGWLVDIRSASYELLLDRLPMPMFRRFSNNLNGQFYPVRFRAGQDIYMYFKNRFPAIDDQELIQVIFLCSDQFIKL